MTLVLIKWMGCSSQLCHCASEWSPWLLSPDLWVDQPFCSREWTSQSSQHHLKFCPSLFYTHTKSFLETWLCSKDFRVKCLLEHQFPNHLESHKKVDLNSDSFFSFRATPMAYGGSQARGQIGAVAAGLHHSQCISELCVQPIPQFMAMPDP